MKILHVINSINPKDGGPIEAIKQITPYLDKKNIDTTIIYSDKPYNINIKSISLGKGIGKYNYNKNLNHWLDKNILKYDLIIIHGIWQYHSITTRKYCLKYKIPYFIFTHGMLDPWFNKKYPIKAIKKNIYWKLFENKVLKDAKAVLFTTEQEMKLASKSFKPFKCNPKVINYGIAKPKLTKKQKILFLSKFPYLKNKKILLYLGRIHEKKGVDLLIKAFSLVKPDYYLVIAGPKDKYTKKMQKLAIKLSIKNIIFTGMLKNDLKWGAFQSSNAFILPSHQENFGIAVVEALACGVPVLITNKVNIWGKIKKENAGIIENDNLNGTIKLLNSIDKLNKNNTIKCFEKHFKIKKTVESLLKVIK